MINNMIFEYVYRLGKRYTELMNKFNEQTFYTYNLHFFILLGLVVHGFNFSTWRAGVGRSLWVEGKSGLCNELQAAMIAYPYSYLDK